MAFTEEPNLLSRFQRTANRQLCPECGASMTLIYWGKENGTLFAWYNCDRDNCKSQWLKKISNASPSDLKKVVSE